MRSEILWTCVTRHFESSLVSSYFVTAFAIKMVKMAALYLGPEQAMLERLNPEQ